MRSFDNRRRFSGLHDPIDPHRTTLLLLPGLDGTAVFFRPLIECLDPALQVISVTFPDDGPYAYADLLARIRKHVAEFTDVVVLGTSFSGPLAVMLAEAEPDKVRSLILCATFLRSPRPRLTPLRAVIRGPLVGALRAARRLPVWIRRRDDALRIAKRETWALVSARGLAGRARAVLEVDVRTSFVRCGQPVLSVAWSGDRVVASRWSDEIRSLRPDTEHLGLPGGHLGLFDEPRPLAAAILRFVERTAARG